MTCVFRFALQMEFGRDTASTGGRLTCRQRIDHGGVGLLSILIASLLWDRLLRATIGLLTAGLGLFFTDLIHDFFVL